MFAAELDRMLAQYGRPATLRRVVGTDSHHTFVDCPVRAFVPRQSTDARLSLSNQNDFTAILSVTDITAGQWPGGQPIQSPPSAIDPRIPRTNDRLILDGRERTIVSADPVFEGGELIRLNLQVKG